MDERLRRLDCGRHVGPRAPPVVWPSGSCISPTHDSERLVAGPGAVVVDQNPDVVLPNWQKHPRIAVAQVTFEGRTWFVLAMGPAHDEPFYSAYEGSVVPASTLDGFLDFLRDEGTDK